MNNFCRLCRRTGEYEFIPICEISRSHQGEQIAAIMADCLRIPIAPSDGLPQQICSLCQAQLEMFYLLKKISFNSDSYFKELLHQTDPLPIPAAVVLPNPDFDLSVNPFDSPSNQCQPVNPEIKTEPPELLEELLPPQACYEDTDETILNQTPVALPADTEWTEPMKKRKKPRIRHTCKECGYTSPYKANVYRHMKQLRHGKLEEMAPVRKIRPSLQEMLANKKIFSCLTCGYKSSFKGNVERHLRCRGHDGIDVRPLCSIKPRTTDQQKLTTRQEQPAEHKKDQPSSSETQQDFMQEVRDEFMKIGASIKTEDFEQQQ